LRARNDFPFVSVPVTWEELDRLRKKGDLSALRFDPESVLKRVEKIGELFAPLLTLEQDLSSGAEKKRRAAPEGKSAAKKVAPKKAATIKAAEQGNAAEPAKFVEPMLLLRTDRLPEGAAWLYELKLDGYRALASKTGERVDLRSRNDKDFVPRFPAIAAALEKLPDGTTVDGEIVALDDEGRPSFQSVAELRFGRRSDRLLRVRPSAATGKRRHERDADKKTGAFEGESATQTQ
jgi:ATP-dependent DNA ligase